MTVNSKVAVLVKNSIILWTLLASLSNWRVAALLTAVTHVALYFVKICPVEKEKVEQVFQHLRERCRSSKQPIILHRAGYDVAPENSLPSIQAAGERKAVGVEIDLTFTKDGFCVLSHDPSIDRLSNSRGEIGKMTFAYLRQINIAEKHPRKEELGFVHMPSLEEGLVECRKQDLFIVLDCKGAFHASETAELLNNLFAKYPDLYSNAVVASFFPHVIYQVRKSNPKILTAHLYREHALEALVAYAPTHLQVLLAPVARCLDVPFNWLQLAWLWYLCGTSIVVAHMDSLSSGMLRYWQGLELDVIAWTVNSPNDKQYFLESLQVPIISDSLNP